MPSPSISSSALPVGTLCTHTNHQLSEYFKLVGSALSDYRMPPPHLEELHHSPNARFQSGNRVYRVVILGQGGVGKSGQFLPVQGSGAKDEIASRF